MLSSCL